MALNVATIVLMAACVALNVTLGGIVYLLKLPVYLDSIGIVLAALLVSGSRWRAFVLASIVAVLTCFITGLTVNPFLPWFTGTAVAAAAFGAFVLRGRAEDLITRKAKLVMFIIKLICYGVAWGILAAIVSAPVVVYLFGGVTGNGTALLVAFFVKTGQQLLNAALLLGLTAEPFDKTLQLLCALIMAGWTPASFRKHLKQVA
jgi:energy-coupling factor transport system substrate-specific component